MTRPRGFASWKPQGKTLALLAQVETVLAEYEAYLPLTIRQVFYRLVGQFGYDKTEQAYSRLCEIFNRARRAGLIPFDAIRDDGGTRIDPPAWAGVASFKRSVAQTAEAYRLDRQHGQERRLWVMCEAGGMVPMLSAAAAPYGVSVLSSGGFDSLTAKHELAEELTQADAAPEVLHLGDYDPSGVHLFSALAEDVGAMVRALGGASPVFFRLAVTPAQIADLALPSAPPKKTDRRAFDDDRAVQCEAIPPDVLTGILKAAIEARRCAEITEGVLMQEQQDRAELTKWIGR